MFDSLKNRLLLPLLNEVGATDFNALQADAVTGNFIE